MFPPTLKNMTSTSAALYTRPIPSLSKSVPTAVVVPTAVAAPPENKQIFPEFPLSKPPDGEGELEQAPGNKTQISGPTASAARPPVSTAIGPTPAPETTPVDMATPGTLNALSVLLSALNQVTVNYQTYFTESPTAASGLATAAATTVTVSEFPTSSFESVVNSFISSALSSVPISNALGHATAGNGPSIDEPANSAVAPVLKSAPVKRSAAPRNVCSWDDTVNRRGAIVISSHSATNYVGTQHAADFPPPFVSQPSNHFCPAYHAAHHAHLHHHHHHHHPSADAVFNNDTAVAYVVFRAADNAVNIVYFLNRNHQQHYSDNQEILINHVVVVRTFIIGGRNINDDPTPERNARAARPRRRRPGRSRTPRAAAVADAMKDALDMPDATDPDSSRGGGAIPSSSRQKYTTLFGHQGEEELDDSSSGGIEIVRPDSRVVVDLNKHPAQGWHEQLLTAATEERMQAERGEHKPPTSAPDYEGRGMSTRHGDMQGQEEVAYGPLAQSESEQAAIRNEENERRVIDTLHDELTQSAYLRAMMAQVAILAQKAPKASLHHVDAGGAAGDLEASARDFHDTNHFRRLTSDFLGKTVPFSEYGYVKDTGVDMPDPRATDAAASHQPFSLFGEGGGGRSSNPATRGFLAQDNDLTVGSEKPKVFPSRGDEGCDEWCERYLHEEQRILGELAKLKSNANCQAPDGDDDDLSVSPGDDDVSDAEDNQRQDHTQVPDPDMDLDSDQDSPAEDDDDPNDGDYREAGDEQRQHVSLDRDKLEEEEEEEEDKDDYEDEIVHSPIKYELRTAARQVRPIMTNIVDWDKSGDYDPLAKGPPKTPDRRPKAKRQREDGEESPGKRMRSARQLSPSKARQLGAAWVVTLELQSEAGRELLSNYQDNWPEAEYNNLSSNNPLLAPPAEDGDDDSPTRRCMRPRRRPIRYDTSPFTIDDLPVIADPTGEQDDLRNHPAARGCVRCREVGKVCDLRKPGAVWPCVQCLTEYKDVDGHVPCELLTLPERKQQCEPCQYHGLECSYGVEEGEDVQDDHSGPCRQCATSGERSIAGPHKDAIRVRATYTPPPDVRYVKYRAFVTCTECRRARRHCSLRKKEDDPPCDSCLDAGIECTFERLPSAAKLASRSGHATQSPSKDRPECDHDPSAKHDAMDVDNHFVETGLEHDWRGSTEVIAGPSTHPNDANKGKQKATEVTADPFTDSNGRGNQLPMDMTTGPMAYYSKFMSPEQLAMMVDKTMQQPRPKKKIQQQGSVKLINPRSTLEVKKKEYVPSDEPFEAATSADVPKIEMEDVHNNKGYVDRLFTAFAHPIQFSLNRDGCNFCKSLSYGQYGIGWRKAEVIAWSNQRGFTELEGGHRGEGVEAAFMCRRCVVERFQIASCNSIAFHRANDFQRLWPVSISSAKKEMAMAAQWNRLVNGQPSSSDKWCSICVAPASFECCRSPQPGRPGCALQLCDGCYHELMACGRGGLQQFLKQKLRSEKAMTYARADACFLFRDSILCKSVFEQSRKSKG
ncbi:hypothetical protein IWX91DRAFT_381715 [Phyllosticta citricarpa]